MLYLFNQVGELSVKTLQQNLADLVSNPQAFLEQRNSGCLSRRTTKDRSQFLGAYSTKILRVPYRFALFHSPAQGSSLRPVAIQHLTLVRNLPARLVLFAPETKIQCIQQ